MQILGQSFANGYASAVQNVTGLTYNWLDAQGNLKMLLSPSGLRLTMGAFDYDAFGQLLPESDYYYGGMFGPRDLTITSLGYAGEYRDPNTGLIYLRDRWMNPATGRFTQMDRYRRGAGSDLLGWNLFGYANGDPVNGRDPSGLSFIDTLMVTGLKAAQFAMKAAPVLKIGFAVLDAITISHILYKGFTEGFGKITALEWAAFAGATVGLVGATGAKLIMKTAVGWLLHLPINPALKTFEGAENAVGLYANLSKVSEPIQTAEGLAHAIFRVEESGKVYIFYYRTGDAAIDAMTLIHEMVHVVHWMWRGRPVGQAFSKFMAEVKILEQNEQIFEKIARFVFELAS